MQSEQSYYSPDLPRSAQEMNQFVDERLLRAKILNKFFPANDAVQNIKYKVPPLTQLCCLSIINKPEVLQKIPALHEGLQQIVLENAINVSQWVQIRQYCTDGAIQTAAKVILIRLGQLSFLDRWVGTTTEEKLWRHIFRQVIVNCDQTKIESCIEIYRNEQLKVVAKARKVQSAFVRYGTRVSAFLVHPWVQVGTQWACWAGTYCIGWYAIERIRSVLQKTLIPKAVNKLINHTPVHLIRKGTKLYDVGAWTFRWRYYLITTLWIGTIGATPNSIINKVYSGVSYVFNIPSKIANMPGRCLSGVANRIYHSTSGLSLMVGDILEKGADIVEANRLTNELNKTCELWLDQIKAHKIIKADKAN